MSISAKSTILLNFTDQKQLSTLLSAVSPEINNSSTRRASVQLKKNGLSLVIAVEAEDTVALRATLNAYLRWINSTINVMNVLARPKSP